MAANQTDRTDNAKLTVTPVQTMPAPTVDNAPPNSNGALKVPADYV
jgi:hypothetical protein